MNDKIEPFHLALLVNMTQTGVVIMSLPQKLALYFGYNGWIVIVAVSLIATLNIGLIAWVYRLSGSRSIFDVMESSLSKWVLAPFYLGLACVWSMAGMLVAKQYIFLYQMISYPTIEPMFILFLLSLLTYLLLIKGIVGISKAATVFFWLTIWMTLLLLCFYPEFRWSRLTPFFLHGNGPIGKGFSEIYTAFIGYELMLLVFPYFKGSKAFVPMMSGNLITTFSYISVSLVCFGFFSFGQLQLLTFPVIDLLAYIRFPFIERLENLFFGVFLFTVILTGVMFSWAAQQAVARLVPKMPSKWLSLIIVFLTYLASWIPTMMKDVQKWLKVIGFVETGVAFGLPVILLLLLWRQKGKKVKGYA